MSRYEYTTEIDGISYEPPAPIVEIRISKPESTDFKKVNGLVDTGADITSIPQNMIDELSLLPVSECLVIGAKSDTTEIAEGDDMEITYSASFSLENKNFCMEIVGNKIGEVLIGRDIINELTILLKGKEQIFEITDP
ncbi:protease [bacterium]|nr:protease [bacterium]